MADLMCDCCGRATIPGKVKGNSFWCKECVKKHNINISMMIKKFNLKVVDL